MAGAFHRHSPGADDLDIPLGSRIFQIDFDFVDHRLNVLLANGGSRSLPLRPRSVAEFYQVFMAALSELGIRLKITTNPVEAENIIPFDEDSVHAAYDRTYVQRWWRIRLQVDRLLQRYRTRFVGKSSPVQFWWGAFDLSETRYSGRPLPERQWPARWQSLGAHQEFAEAGFWPGGGTFLEPAFFAYAVPEPPGLRDASISPGPAGYHSPLGEFILPYKEVTRSSSPDKMVLDFLNSTYEVEADLGGWDRKALELPDPLPGP